MFFSLFHSSFMFCSFESNYNWREKILGKGLETNLKGCELYSLLFRRTILKYNLFHFAIVFKFAIFL